MLLDDEEAFTAFNDLARDIHAANVEAGWWTRLSEGTRDCILAERNRGEMLMLSVTELSEAEEANETCAFDDKLPHRLGLHVEIADCAIRVLDLLGAEARLHGGDPMQPVSNTLPRLNPSQSMTELAAYRQGVSGDLMRITRDLSNALDKGYRKDKVKIARFWLTSAFYRMIAYCWLEHIPLFDIIEEKRAYNAHRADHKIENRMKEGGKKC